MAWFESLHFSNGSVPMGFLVFMVFAVLAFDVFLRRHNRLRMVKLGRAAPRPRKKPEAENLLLILFILAAMVSSLIRYFGA